MGTVNTGSSAAILTGAPLGHRLKSGEEAQLIPEDHRTPPAAISIKIAAGVGAIAGGSAGVAIVYDYLFGSVPRSMPLWKQGGITVLGAAVGAAVLAAAWSFLGSSAKSNGQKSEYVIDDVGLSPRINEIFGFDQIDEARSILASSTRDPRDAKLVLDAVELAQVAYYDELELLELALSSKHSGTDLRQAAISINSSYKDKVSAFGPDEHHDKRMGLMRQIISVDQSIAAVPALTQSRWIMSASGDERAERFQVAADSGLTDSQFEQILEAISKVEVAAPNGVKTMDLGRVLATHATPEKIVQAADDALALYDAQRPHEDSVESFFFNELR